MRLFIAREAVDHFKLASDRQPRVHAEGETRRWRMRRRSTNPVSVRWLNASRLTFGDSRSPPCTLRRADDATPRSLVFHAMVRFGPKLERRQMVLFARSTSAPSCSRCRRRASGADAREAGRPEAVTSPTRVPPRARPNQGHFDHLSAPTTRFTRSRWKCCGAITRG
jgi:hypothetical protein